MVGFESRTALLAPIITQSYATGSVEGNTQVGGLVGTNQGTITQAYATGAVSGFESVGGLVGSNQIPFQAQLAGVTISLTSASGSVSGSDTLGGLVGDNSFGTITQSFATGAVTGTGGDLGGFAGVNAITASTGAITQAFATGTVNQHGRRIRGWWICRPQ